jgi:hypothetical protein
MYLKYICTRIVSQRTNFTSSCPGGGQKER